MASGDRLAIEVLGPLRVRDAAGADRTPDGPLQRRLLALLVLRRGQAVSADAAIDVLWPERQPRDPVAALHNHVFRLRQRLPDGVVDSAGDGYRLDPATIDLDADRLLQLVQADDADHQDGAELEELVARWHGPAYPELDDVDDGRAEAARLEDLRVRALEARAEHRLAVGATDGLVADLTALAEQAPLRERPRQLLMAALAATGRHVDALRVYDDFRRLLGDELGIEPSPVLAAHHAELLAGVDPAPDVRTVAGTRLPVPPGAFVGRDDLLAELEGAVADHRVLTLVGPGGMGKTRLSLELAHRLRAARPDRPIVLCELAQASPTSVLDEVTAALGIDGRPGVTPAERVATVLGDSEVVLLLDNCEHVLEPIASLVEHLVARCPEVTVLATSRERLRVRGERVWVLPALGWSEADAAAVELFVDRARDGVPGFEPAPADLAVIGEIARRLDGLPLGIELAAACLHTQSVAEVAAGLDHRFSLLSSGYRASDRHGSLRAAVSWSFELLEPPLQDVFETLAAFTSPFTVGAAAAVCDQDHARTASALAQLVERSLLTRAPDQRYLMLETLREFGRERLDATGRLEVVGDRHARHHVEWAEDAGRRLRVPGERCIAEIDDALPELRAAMDWLLEHGEVVLAGRLVAALLDYCFLRLRPEVLGWGERIAALDPEDRSPAAARVWVVASYAAWTAGDLRESIARSERARRVVEQSAEGMTADVASSLASGALFEGKLQEAAEAYRHAVELSGDGPERHLLARCSGLLPLGYDGDPRAEARAEEVLAELGGTDTAYAAYAWYCAGEAILGLDPVRARERFVRALDLASRTGASFVAGIAGTSKASIDARHGDPEEAAAEYRRVLLRWRRAGMWSTQWTLLRSVAGLLARLERFEDAAVLEGAVRSTESGHRIFGADEIALTELSGVLRGELGDDAYDAALARGARLDGDAAVEHALRAL